jgi:hypothetical protein
VSRQTTAALVLALGAAKPLKIPSTSNFTSGDRRWHWCAGLPPDSSQLSLPWFGLPRLGLDRLGLTQAIGGVALSLIALFSSYDPITLLGRTLQLQQQWGIPFIATSVAIVVVDAELATRSRLRAAHERARDQNSADEERNRAAEARNRAAETAERQRQATARLHRCALLSARVLLDPSDINRARLQAFLTLISQVPPEDGMA